MHLLYSLADYPARHWEGNLIYIPPDVSAEGFRGVVREFQKVMREIPIPGNLDLSFTVGDDFALVGLGTSEEYEVEQVFDQGPGFLEAIWTGGGGTYFCYLWYSYSMPFHRA